MLRTGATSKKSATSIADFKIIHLHLATPLGVTPFEFCRELWRHRTRVSSQYDDVVSFKYATFNAREQFLNGNLAYATLFSSSYYLQQPDDKVQLVDVADADQICAKCILTA